MLYCLDITSERKREREKETYEVSSRNLNILFKIIFSKDPKIIQYVEIEYF